MNRLHLLFALLAALFLAAPAGRAAAPETADHEMRIQRLQEGLVEQKLKILGSKKEERSVLADLEAIDQKLMDQRQRLAEAQQRQEAHQRLLENKEEERGRIEAEKHVYAVHVRKRLASYYRLGSVGVMNVAFSSKTLPELLSFQDHFHFLLERDRQIFTGFRRQLKELDEIEKLIDEENRLLAALVEEISRTEEELGAVKQEKTALLRRINTEKSLYEQAARELETAAMNLADTLGKIRAKSERQRQEPPKRLVPDESKKTVTPAEEAAPAGVVAETPVPAPPPAPVARGFAARRGSLPPPLAGTLVTRYGEKKEHGVSAVAASKGIDITAPAGTPVRAVYPGRVIHVGYLRGYGNMIIIDHGDLYFTLLSRVESFTKKVGERTEAGEAIGRVGDDVDLLGQGVHFEIRRGAETMDPLEWIDSSRLAGLRQP